MSASETSKLFKEYALLIRNADIAVQAMGRREFPPGTRVRWVRTFDRSGAPIFLQGVVQPFNANDRHAPVMTPSGAIHQVAWHELDLSHQSTSRVANAQPLTPARF